MKVAMSENDKLFLVFPEHLDGDDEIQIVAGKDENEVLKKVKLNEAKSEIYREYIRDFSLNMGWGHRYYTEYDFNVFKPLHKEEWEYIDYIFRENIEHFFGKRSDLYEEYMTARDQWLDEDEFEFSDELYEYIALNDDHWIEWHIEEIEIEKAGILV